MINDLLTTDDDSKVIVVDKANPDSLWSFPPLQRYKNSGRITYKWQSMGDRLSLPVDVNSDYLVDNIVFTSAIADVPYAISSPIDTYNVNVINTLSFYESLREHHFQGRLIMMSSESVYGHHPVEELPLNEDKTMPKPSNVYGSSKLAQEQIALTYYRSYGLESTVLRSATMFGPYSRTKQAIPIFLTQVLDNKPVTLEGDGSQSRDFIYVLNTVDAIKKALKAKDVQGEIINIGSGKETSFIGLIQAMKVLCGFTTKHKDPRYVPIEYKPWRAGEKGLRVLLDIKKAKEKLGYYPLYDMQAGLKMTAKWIGRDVIGFDEEDMDKLSAILDPEDAINSGQKVGETTQIQG